MEMNAISTAPMIEFKNFIEEYAKENFYIW